MRSDALLSPLRDIASAVEDHSQRIVDLAGDLDDSRSSDAIADLYEAERSLRMAGRALARAAKALS